MTFKPLRGYSAAAVLNVALFTLLYAFVPAVRPSFVMEDRFMEHLSALMFLGAFIAGILYAAQGFSKGYRASWLMVPALGLIAFLDEMSFGERILSARMPKVFGYEVGSLHDVVFTAFRRFRDQGDIVPAAVVTALFAAVCLFIIFKYKGRFGRISALFRESSPLALVLVACGFVAAAMGIDLLMNLGIISEQAEAVRFVEELFEMNAAFALMFGAVLTSARAEEDGAPSAFRFTKGLVATTCAALVISGCALLYYNHLIEVKKETVALLREKLVEAGKFLERDELELALMRAEEMDEISPGYMGTHYIRFLVSAKKGDKDEALRHAKETYRLAGYVRLRDVQLFLISYYSSKGRTDEAGELARETLRHWPDVPELREKIERIMGRPISKER